MTLEFDVHAKLGPFSYEAAFDARDEIVVLFGHSGAGKSLTLQFIAGLMRPRGGRIAVDGEVLYDAAAKVDLPPQRRRVGYVVQELALFDHLSVADNITFGMPRGVDRRARLSELLELLGLEGYERRRPTTLSGGQRQRVALARALAREAPLLLLDEPFSALDDSLRNAMRKELLRLRSRLGLTVLFVTHDLREAHLLADRLAVFDGGRLLQIGGRDEVFRRPANRRVAELTGVANIWRGRITSTSPGCLVVDVEGLGLRVAQPPGDFRFEEGGNVDLMLRAERVILRRDMSPERGGNNVFPGNVIEESAYGSSHSLQVRPEGPGPVVEIEIASRPYDVLGIAQRKRFNVEIDPADVHVVPGE